MAQFPRHLPSRFVVDAGRAEAESSKSPGAGAVLTFEPDAAVRAIVFHMLDEGLAREVAHQSIAKAVARLRRRRVRPSIRRTTWERMSNHDRLEWLLAESHVVPLMQPDDDIVTLAAGDER